MLIKILQPFAEFCHQAELITGPSDHALGLRTVTTWDLARTGSGDTSAPEVVEELMSDGLMAKWNVGKSDEEQVKGGGDGMGQRKKFDAFVCF